MITVFFHKVQLAVTYTHSAAWEGPIPAAQGTSLPRTLEKLKNGKLLTIVCYGDSILGAENAVGVAERSPDLVIIAFGLNDANQGARTGAFEESIRAIMDTIRAANPDCEFILVSPMRSNAEAWDFRAEPLNSYLRALREMTGEGVALADMTTLHTYMLTRKAFRDITGNNVNHPNDFLTRAYAQVLLRTMEKPAE